MNRGIFHSPTNGLHANHIRICTENGLILQHFPAVETHISGVHSRWYTRASTITDMCANYMRKCRVHVCHFVEVLLCVLCCVALRVEQSVCRIECTRTAMCWWCSNCRPTSTRHKTTRCGRARYRLKIAIRIAHAGSFLRHTHVRQCVMCMFYCTMFVTMHI